MKYSKKQLSCLVEYLVYVLVIMMIWYTYPIKAQEQEPTTLDVMAGQDYSSEFWEQDFCSTAFEYCVPLHRNFWYNTFLETDGSGRGFTEFSTSVIENDGDGPIKIYVRSGQYKGTKGQVVSQGDNIVIVLDRDADTYFELFASSRLEQPLLYMADRFRIATEEEIKEVKEQRESLSSQSESSEASEATGTSNLARSSFSDVSKDHQYYKQIQKLYAVGVIQGNPDGTFAPERIVNRAEMIVMLYRALSFDHDVVNKLCFPDVDASQWYASYVCHAAESGFVDGYQDGSFLPAKEIIRVEGLKMLLEVFGVDPILLNDSSVSLRFVDIAENQWYMPYIIAAFEWNIFPIVGQSDIQFGPSTSLTRAEVAAWIHAIMYESDYVYRRGSTEALHRDELVGEDDPTEPEEELNETDEESSNGNSGNDSEGYQEGRFEESFSVDEQSDTEFFFRDQGTFDGRRTIAYKFDVTAQTLLRTLVQVEGNGSVLCRLYRIEETGFAQEYYLGLQEGQDCHQLTMLEQGSYQLQISPTQPDVDYELSVVESEGDGNDGFVEAVPISIGSTSSTTLTPEDIEDWYTFKLFNEKDLTLSIQSAIGDDVDCLVYPMGDVDLFGFSGPICNEMYAYPPGTYYVSVRKSEGYKQSQNYSLSLQ